MSLNLFSSKETHSCSTFSLIPKFLLLLSLPMPTRRSLLLLWSKPSVRLVEGGTDPLPLHICLILGLRSLGGVSLVHILSSPRAEPGRPPGLLRRGGRAPGLCGFLCGSDAHSWGQSSN